LFILITLGEMHKLCSSSLRTFLQPPASSYLLVPNTLLSNRLPNTLKLCSSLNVREIKTIVINTKLSFT
jgi:hypothetical protein